jgi:hypothetical protein
MYCSVVNFIYPILIVVSLFYSYIYDVFICQGKLNVVSDIVSFEIFSVKLYFLLKNSLFSRAKNPVNLATTKRINSTINSWNSKYESQVIGKQNLDTTEPVSEVCGHIITTYILPSILHLASFIMGFVYFRINENEQLYALMEKVFLSSMKLVSQDTVIRRLK